MTNRKRIGYLLTLGALLISIPRYIAVLDGIDPVSITAYGMGILLAGGAAYIFDAWADARHRNRKNANRLLAAFGLNLAYEPALLTPFVLARLWSEPLADVMSPAYAVFWSIMVTAAPVFLVAGIVYAVSFQKDSRKAAEDSGTDRKTTESEPELSTERMTFSAFCAEYPDILTMTDRQIAGLAGITDRTARNWLAKARNGGSPHPEALCTTTETK